MNINGIRSRGDVKFLILKRNIRNGTYKKKKSFGKKSQKAALFRKFRNVHIMVIRTRISNTIFAR